MTLISPLCLLYLIELEITFKKISRSKVSSPKTSNSLLDKLQFSDISFSKVKISRNSQRLRISFSIFIGLKCSSRASGFLVKIKRF